MAAYALDGSGLWLPERPKLWRPEWLEKLRRKLLMEGQWFPKQGVQFEGGPHKPSAAKSLVYLDANDTDTDATSFSFASQPLGTATSDRRILVSVCGINAGSGTISTVTVAGVSAAKLVEATRNNNTSSIWIAEVPSGTTGTISGTCSTTKSRYGIGTWAVYGLTSNTPLDTDFTSGTGALSRTLTTTVGGLVFALSSDASSNINTMTGVTQDFDEIVGAASEHIGGSAVATGVTTTIDVASAGASDKTITAVSF